MYIIYGSQRLDDPRESTQAFTQYFPVITNGTVHLPSSRMLTDRALLLTSFITKRIEDGLKMVELCC